MLPQSPVIPNSWTTRNIPNKYKDLEVVYAKNQPEYIPLPSIKTVEGQVITRWRFSLKERIKLLLTGNLYLSLLTFNQPLQPIQLSVDAPKLDIVHRALIINEDFEEKLA